MEPNWKKLGKRGWGLGWSSAKPEELVGRMVVLRKVGIGLGQKKIKRPRRPEVPR